MPAHVPKPTPHSSSLEIAPKPVSMRSLDYRRGSKPADPTDRVRGEFFEMRGFSPTVDQAARLFNLPREECRRILRGLVQEGFLHCTADGRYRLPA